MDSANRVLGLGLPRKMTSESRKFRLSKKNFFQKFLKIDFGQIASTSASQGFST